MNNRTHHRPGSSPSTATARELPAYTRLPIVVIAAEGDELLVGDGRRILDLYGGHCVNVLGAGNHPLGVRLRDQWQRLSFATNLLPTPERMAFAEALERTLPPGDWCYFLSNSGAEANENALKLALGATGRDTIVCFEGAFHGRTAATAALSDCPPNAFPATPFRVERCPWGDLNAVRHALGRGVAGIILEPIQSLAGVVEPPEGFLQGLRTACDASGSLLLFDEVQTGSGRLGSPWASQTFAVRPDVFTSAKGIAAGFPMGLTVVDAEVAERVPGALFGSTFGGGPMALAAATHVAQALMEPTFLPHVRELSAAFKRLCQPLDPVRAVRGSGLLLGLELEPPYSAVRVRDALLEHDILVGTSCDPGVLRLSPPLNLSPSAPARLARALKALSLKSLSESEHNHA